MIVCVFVRMRCVREVTGSVCKKPQDVITEARRYKNRPGHTHTHSVLLGVSVIFPLSVSCNVSASHAVAQAAVR